MKKLAFIIFLLSTSAASADDKPAATCNLNDMKSMCTITVSVEDLVAMGNTLEEAPVPHKVWGNAWSHIQAQILSQQAKAKTTH